MFYLSRAGGLHYYMMFDVFERWDPLKFQKGERMHTPNNNYKLLLMYYMSDLLVLLVDVVIFPIIFVNNVVFGVYLEQVLTYKETGSGD